MFTETDERNAWLALKSTANRILRKIDELADDREVLQENVTALETIRTERATLSLPDRLSRRGLYAEGNEHETADKN